MSSALAVATPAYAADPPQGIVRVVYLVPADRPPRVDYLNVTTAAIEHLQQWLWDAIGVGKTFTVNTPAVELLPTPHDASWYVTHDSGRESSLWFFDNVISDAFTLTGAIFDDPAYRWVFYIDSEPAAGQQVGAAAGVAVLPRHDLLGLIGETTEPVCRWVGGLGHELGHAFGLPHPPECEGPGGDQSRPNCQSLMYLGYLTYPTTFLTADDLSRLAQNPFIVGGDRPNYQVQCSDLLAAAPTISSAELQGNRLIVFGSNFSVDATVMIDGESHSTTNNQKDPTTRLVVRGNSIARHRGELIRLQVVNGDGMTSAQFEFLVPSRLK